MMIYEKWSVIELSFPGKQEGNPFTDYDISGIFKCEKESKTISGFYDGDGIYKIRFMPSFVGVYHYDVKGSFNEDCFTGDFQVEEAAEGNRGMVKVANQYYFSYEDGTAYYPVGTTCYAWLFQKQELRQQTLNTLKEGYFNKLRFCIFPKYYDFNREDPELFPFERLDYDNQQEGAYQWDYTRFNPSYFEVFEEYIGELMKLGIEADIILFHPYDRWGFSKMPTEVNEAYLKYVIARLSVYPNIWWSMANEYDIMSHVSTTDWEYYAKILVENDPYGHLRSIHNCGPFYDYTKPWITHASIQRQDVYKCAEYTEEYREKYGKPVVLDEIAYEGNFPYAWGNISAQELVRRFWEATIRGGYATHGETYLTEDEVIWWSHGGTLHGESAERIKFLKGILEQVPGNGLKNVKYSWDEVVACAEEEDNYKIFYYGFCRPSYRIFEYLEDECRYHVEIIDTWNITIHDMGVHEGKFRLTLPGKEYMAVRVRKIG